MLSKIESHPNFCHQMSDFKAKMHQIRFRLGLRPRPRWEEAYSALLDPLAGFGGHFAAGEGLGWGRGREGEGGGSGGREREGPNLLLNQGPSKPCYATENVVFNFGIKPVNESELVH